MTDILKQIRICAGVTPGSDSFARLLKAFPDTDAIDRANEAQLSAALGGHRRDIRRLLERDTDGAERMLEFCSSIGVSVLTYWDERYPEPLRRIPDPPAWIFVKGHLPAFGRLPSVAVVGTRKPGEYGVRMTYELSRDLSRAGCVIVSGMALGVDGIAASAALDAGGTTVAVLGNGLDIVYPAGHAYLEREILARGAVLSEYPPGTPPDRWNFPKRNRIISALADAVLVTEGSLHSGSLITADYAVKQDKPLYALPGQVDSPGGEGPMKLLREGAYPVACAEDILIALEKQYPACVNVFSLLREEQYDAEKSAKRHHLGVVPERRRSAAPTVAAPTVAAPSVEPPKTDSAKPKAAFQADGLDPAVRALYERIPADRECTPDTLVSPDCSMASINASLTILELYGLISVAPGDRIRRI